MQTAFTDTTPLTAPLTQRECDVLRLLALGLLTRDVAQRLGIGVATVKAHLKRIYLKTGSQNKIEALNRTRWLTASRQAPDTNCR